MFKAKFPYYVRVPASNDPEYGHKTIEWLRERNKRPDRDYEIDMHGGQSGYTSFWFKNLKLARYTLVVWG